ncbi:prolyl oligopeptidase family serine peptidase [Parapedobacter sp. SGR-10]|uniref:alpha/beta hydrolase family protein n=1 Tax=Parapedobacter sp. SGR-10 TaxID=2710879 RepID=UPI0013D8BE29|nr:prolyl oligopeptidase family serine peptidase [Parapedobacter sp. SGR-10]NGF56373.1 prolyl oligopeptidase family serine peptidase [Parapedobacter sp. SGR-10]
MKKFSVIILTVLSLQFAHGQKAELFRAISPYFSPPDSLKNDFGDFRSPLLFNDGTPVKTAQQWAKRKQEIKKDWENYLGKWPELYKDQTFEYLDTTDKGTYTQYTVRFKWTPNESTVGFLLVPKNVKGKMPAVVTVFYNAETSIGIGTQSRPLAPHRDFALQLANRGFVTLAIGTKEASERNEFSLYYPSIDSVSVQPLSMLGYAANNAYYVLANRKDVDAKKIGIVGHSFGGKWSMFASCLTDNFAAAVWSDPGIVMQEDRGSINYWEPWYLGFHPKPWRKRGLITKENPAYGVYDRLRKDGHNLHELHALMAPRPFLVSGGSEDPVTQWRPLNHSVAVNKLLGYENRVAMTNRPKHALTEDATENIYKFFEYFLKYQ